MSAFKNGLSKLLFALFVSITLNGYLMASETYIAVLNSEQTLSQAVNSDAYGYAVFTFNEDAKLLCYARTVNNLTGEEVSSEFVLGKPGEQDYQVIPENPPESEFTSNLKTGCLGPLTDSEISALRNGRFHINVSSNYYPEGEIAGQIVYMSHGNDQAIESLLALGPDQWQIFQALLSLNEERWVALGEIIQQEGAAVISSNGVSSLQNSTGGGIVVDAAALRNIADVANAVSSAQTAEDPNTITLFTHDSDIKSELSNIIGRLPDAPNVRSLYTRVPLQNVKDLIDQAKEEASDIILFVKDLRDNGGYDSWKGSDCDTNSECYKFKQDLEGVLDDLQRVWEGVQRLSCLDDPDVKIRRLPGFGMDNGQPELFRNLLVNKTPRVALYVLFRMFKPFNDWNSFVGDIADNIPSELTSFCNEDIASPSAAIMSTSNNSCSPESFPGSRKCCVLRKPDTQKALKFLRAEIKLGLLVFDIGESWTTPSKVICLNVTAVAGGGAGTNTPNPTQSVDKTVKLVLTKLDKIVETILKERDDCLNADKQIEEDLLQCNAFAEYLIPEPDGRKGEVDDLVSRRLELLYEQGLVSVKDRDQVEQEISAQGITSFGDLCTAYRRLLNGSNR